MDTMQQSEHDDISDLLSLLEQAHQALARHWLGEDFAIELLLASVIAKGHVLIVDVPGVGKTTLAKSMAKILGLDFNRIQFTNDILPADILGGSIYNSAEGKFSFSPGPYSRISCWQMKSTGAYSQPIGFPASHGRRLRRSRRCELSAVPLIHGDRDPEPHRLR